MANMSASTAHNVTAIKIVKVNGPTKDWYQIYLDDLELCAVFGKDELPAILTYDEEGKGNRI